MQTLIGPSQPFQILSFWDSTCAHTYVCDWLQTAEQLLWVLTSAPLPPLVLSTVANWYQRGKNIIKNKQMVDYQQPC